MIKNKYIIFTYDKKTYLVKFHYGFLRGVKNVTVGVGEENSPFVGDVEVKKVEAYPGLIGYILDKIRMFKAGRHQKSQ